MAQPRSRQTLAQDLFRCRSPFARHSGVDRPRDREPLLPPRRKGCARRFRVGERPADGNRPAETALRADSASRRSGIFQTLHALALRRAVVRAAELPRFRAMERALRHTHRPGNRLLHARNGQPPGRRQRACKSVVPLHRAEPDDRNRSTDARQLGSGPRDRQFQLRIEIHRRPDRPGDLGAAHRGTRLFRGRTGRRRAGTHRSCAEGHRRQGRRTGAMEPFDHPALPR